MGGHILLKSETGQWPILLNNNSIQFFIIYVPSRQLQGQLHTQYSVDIGNYIMDKQNKVKDKLQEIAGGDET
jgi:hypothetical protein